ILERFSMSNCDSVVSPLDPGVHLSKEHCPISYEEELEMRPIPYINTVGA
ncbi:hypothetical protein F5876DRAFT_41784, partial [Lentinula aff. lateritia]